MVGRTDACHLVASEEQRVLPFVRKRTDEPFRKTVVNGVFTVVTVSERLHPEVVEITDHLSHQTSMPRSVF